MVPLPAKSDGEGTIYCLPCDELIKAPPSNVPDPPARRPRRGRSAKSRITPDFIKKGEIKVEVVEDS